MLSKSRSPHGERGLKFFDVGQNAPGTLSLPTRGAWIEISQILEITGALYLSLPTRGAWIEILCLYVYCLYNLCRSPHGERGLKLKPS